MESFAGTVGCRRDKWSHSYHHHIEHCLVDLQQGMECMFFFGEISRRVSRLSSKNIQKLLENATIHSSSGATLALGPVGPRGLDRQRHEPPDRGRGFERREVTTSGSPGAIGAGDVFFFWLGFPRNSKSFLIFFVCFPWFLYADGMFNGIF